MRINTNGTLIDGSGADAVPNTADIQALDEMKYVIRAGVVIRSP